MDTGPEVKRCANCHRSAFQIDMVLRPRNKRKQVWYCNRKCQTAHMQKHKKGYGKPQSSSAATTPSDYSTPATSPEPSGLLQKLHTHPFHDLTKHQWLSNRSRHDVYRLLIDSFRLRLEDCFSYNDEIEVGSVYHNDNEHSVKAFEGYMRMAMETRLLPDWLMREHLEDCVHHGMKSNMVGTDWGGLKTKATEADIIKWYGDDSMPLQMRIFAEQVYGDDPSGQAQDRESQAGITARAA